MSESLISAVVALAWFEAIAQLKRSANDHPYEHAAGYMPI